MKLPKVEQADNSRSHVCSKNAGGFHQYTKLRKHRADRQYAKRCLKDAQEPQDTTKHYEGYET